MYRFYGCSSNIKAAFINVCDGYTYYLCMSVTLTDWSPPHVTGYIPSVVVGVVGIGHVSGIKANWEKEKYNIDQIMV